MTTEIQKFDFSNPPTEVDASACMLEAASPVQFQDTQGDDVTVHPITMIARSPHAIDHWYWGRMVHDLAGCRFHKDTIVVDYCHDDRKVIGYLDSKKIVEAGLEVSGAIVVQPGIAKEVVTNAKHKVPYEASIFFDRDVMLLEQVGEGVTVEVNGTTFEGPGVVAREWSLRAVSVCPHGYDGNTETRFQSDEKGRSVSVTFKESQMSTKNDTPTKPAETGGDVSPVTLEAIDSRLTEFGKNLLGQVKTMLSDERPNQRRSMRQKSLSRSSKRPTKSSKPSWPALPPKLLVMARSQATSRS